MVSLHRSVGDEATWCRALAEYARACAQAGWPLQNWRTQLRQCGGCIVLVGRDGFRQALAWGCGWHPRAQLNVLSCLGP